MTLSDLRRQGRLRPHRTSLEEVANLLRLADRGIADAQIPGVSADGRFRMAYDAVQALATVPLHCAGWRTDGTHHHQTTFAALPIIMGAELADLANYFDACRAKRNTTTYDRGGQISGQEVKELVEEGSALRDMILAWLAATHPSLKP